MDLSQISEDDWSRWMAEADVLVRRRWRSIPPGYDREQFCHDALSRAYQKLLTYLRSNPPVRSFGGLLKTIVDCAVIEERREVLRRLRHEVPTDPRSDTEEAAALDRGIQAVVRRQLRTGGHAPAALEGDQHAEPFRSQFSPSPERVVEKHDRHRLLWKALEMLAACSEQGGKESRAVTLHVMEGWTLKEIAQYVGMSTKQVQRWKDGGLEHLRQILRDHFGITSLGDLGDA